MAYHNRMMCYFFAIVCALTLVACSAAKKPEEVASATGGTGKESTAQKGEGQRGTTKDSDASRGSSLDQLREGKPSVGGPLKDVFFEFDRYDLRADARDTLKANADWLKKNATARVEIEGHCDERGTNEYNLALGAKRSQSAKDYLVTLGISGERLSTISYGEEIPVCREQTEDCRSKNRRARFVIVQGRPAS